MPNVRIKVKRGWVGAQRAAVIDVVHRTMVETIRIPENDRALRLIEHDSDAYSTPPERGDKFTPVEITLSAGCSTGSSSTCTSSARYSNIVDRSVKAAPLPLGHLAGNDHPAR